MERRSVKILEGAPRCESVTARAALGHRRNRNRAELVRHIWSVELRWARRLAGVSETAQTVYLKIDRAILWNAAKVSGCVSAHRSFIVASAISTFFETTLVRLVMRPR